MSLLLPGEESGHHYVSDTWQQIIGRLQKKVIILVNPTMKEVCSHYKRRCPVQVNNVFTYTNNYLICELRAFTPKNLPLKGSM